MFKPTMGAETQHWTSERSGSQDRPRFNTLTYRRQSDSSSAVSSTSASFLSSAADGVSRSDPSPVLPLTPHTSVPLPGGPQESHPFSMKELSGNNRTSMPSCTYTDTPRSPFIDNGEKHSTKGRRFGDEHSSQVLLHRTEASSLCGPAELQDKYGVNYLNSRPVRPW
jgi:hypothetical protein